ncbi:MAG: hypothetical protein HY939_07230 [Gammaproteobacteria bacterium]|nr:hypothetical protein [Gammaproteobacteria bacterium]
MDTSLIQHRSETHTPSYTPHYFIEESSVVSKPLPPVTQYIIDHLLAGKCFTKLTLAKELQVSLVTINRWASGSVKRPTHKTFSRLLMLYCATQETH